VRKRYPELMVDVGVAEGMRLSELRGQDSYSFEIADVFLGADTEEELHEKFRHVMEVLDFQYADVVPTNYNWELIRT